MSIKDMQEALTGNFDTTDRRVVSKPGLLGGLVGIGRATSAHEAEEIARKLSEGTPDTSFSGGGKTFTWGGEWRF